MHTYLNVYVYMHVGQMLFTVVNRTHSSFVSGVLQTFRDSFVFVLLEGDNAVEKINCEG